ncbi:hypothetical protein cypCar_00029769 [Cyprinus carpio]|nr:hypothetical protein cypCar_00029769 [Cyprinus carpio]
MFVTLMMQERMILADAIISDQEQDHYSVRMAKETLKSLQSLRSKDLKETQANEPARILQVDNWEISSSSGMKYGQYVDWEKIDPEAAICYRKILSSDHYELKAMGRTGFWSMPHTLRAKAYQHIIQSIESTSTVADVDTYHALVGKIFGEFQTSTHPFPKFMENGEIPRYCLNKAGLNSVKRILICINLHFPDVSFCPILPALVSLLLHFSKDEAQCFHSICSLVTYTDPKKHYIDQTFLTSHASCMTFGDLANKYCRGIRKLIASSHQNLFEFYSDWIMWIFTDLPFTYAIRVLDVYLMEGYKVLYRVALALLSLYKISVSSRVAHVDDFRQDMKNYVQNVGQHITIDSLLQRAFSLQMPTRKELTYLFNANKEALIHKDILNKRFYSRVEGHDPTVLLLKTADEEICGAFLSSDWAQKNCDEKAFKFFGTGECFVFTVSGDGGHALHLQADLSAGCSEHCDTFESPPLCRGCFKIQSLEVWGIQHSLFVPPLLSQ